MSDPSIRFLGMADKLPESIVIAPSLVIADLVQTLTLETRLTVWRRESMDTESLFTRFGLERGLRAMGLDLSR